MQPNSIDNEEDARLKYIYNNIFRAIIPKFTADEYEYGPFKLICDDLRYGNILVNNKEELKIVAVLDWEWSYAAPYQMLFSPPRWLLLKRPSNWDDEDISRYTGLVKRFVKILTEEDDKRGKKTSMGVLMQQSLDDGKFWYHELVYSCFGSPDDRAWSAIREILPDLDTLETIEYNELQRFAEDKMKERKQYSIEWAAMEERIAKERAGFERKLQKVREETGDFEISDII